MFPQLRSLVKSDFPTREVNRLAFPAIVSAIAEPIISMCDTAIIGQYGQPGDAGIGSVTIGTNFFLSIIWVFAQTRTAMSSVVSRYFGEHQLDKIRTLIPQVIFMNFTLGVFFYLVTNLFAVEIFSLYNAEGAVLQQSVDYFSIRSIGFPFTLSTLLIFGVFRGMQNTWISMVISVTGLVLNILLDIALINGLGDVIPALGAKGVALASVISQIVMFGMAIVMLIRKTPFNLNFLHPVNSEIYSLLKLTGNLIIRSIAVQTAYFFSGRIAASYGEHALNVHGVFWNIWLFSAFVIEGYCSAGNALAGKYFGEKNFESLWRMSQYIFSRTLLLGIGLMLFYFLVYPFIGHLFLRNEEELSLFLSFFWIVALVQPFNALAFTYDELLKGLGRMRYIRDTLIIATFVGFVPVIHLGYWMDWHLLSVWLAFIVWMSIRGIRLMWYFNRHFRY
ncbi:MAG TPA: MATE family efflux transporter [Flavobacteriales bacterium]|nr:MATE family efflux transporter [Flavobacteriales bacterium]